MIRQLCNARGSSFIMYCHLWIMYTCFCHSVDRSKVVEGRILTLHIMPLFHCTRRHGAAVRWNVGHIKIPPSTNTSWSKTLAALLFQLWRTRPPKPFSTVSPNPEHRLAVKWGSVLERIWTVGPPFHGRHCIVRRFESLNEMRRVSVKPDEAITALSLNVFVQAASEKQFCSVRVPAIWSGDNKKSYWQHGYGSFSEVFETIVRISETLESLNFVLPVSSSMNAQKSW